MEGAVSGRRPAAAFSAARQQLPAARQHFRPQANVNNFRPQTNNIANVNNNRINNTNINNRVNNNNVVNHTTNIINNNRANNLSANNFNRYGHPGGYGGYGNYNRGWGGYGGYGGGYHATSYYGNHASWVNGSWGGGLRPGWGGYGGYGGYNGYGFGNSALGIGAGIGIAAWGLGSLFNNFGYSQYSNPYYNSVAGYGPQQQAFASTYDYSRPLNLASAPPAETVLQAEESTLDQARQAFLAGDDIRALGLADKALSATPNDPMLHEFRAVCLFAMGKYDQSAVSFYTVLSSGPGWDWTTMIGLYPGIEVYTGHLRALENYCNANPKAASARFVLAALYLTQGSTEAAAAKFREVVALQPQDRLSAQLIAALSTNEGQQAAAQSTNPAQPPADPALAQPASTPPAGSPQPAEAPALPTGPVPANLVGTWTATPAPDVKLTLTLAGDKSFTWNVNEKGQTREFKGEPTFDNDTIALVTPEMPPMLAKVTFKDPAHFNFKAVGGPAEDRGLDFGK